MDVLNFAHGAFFAWGAYVGVWAFTLTGSFLVALLLAMVAGFCLGALTERLIIQPVYGNHTQQILITLGLMLVLSEMLKVVWGPNQLYATVPEFMRGSWILGNIIVIKYRVFIIAIGLFVFFLTYLLLKKTRIGLIVRAGVMNKEMVQPLGINIKKVFLYVFMLGSAMAALGGALLGPYSGVVYAEMGMEFAILAFIVVVIGGLGSFTGSLIASIIVGVVGSFTAFFIPELSLAANMLIMLVVLMVKPQGLFAR